jgi:predicted outer membrane repeat protein
MTRRRSVLTGTGLALGASLITGAASAQAATYVVDTKTDSALPNACTSAPGDCTLRGAVNDSNATPSTTDTITFASNVTGTITLNGDDLYIHDGVSIYGPGANVLTISGDGSERLMGVVLASDGEDLRINDLTLANGYAESGGAIFNSNATLKIVRSVLTGNHATLDGGAIYTEELNGYGNEIRGSTISGNYAAGNGGGIAADTSAGSIYSSTISGNFAGSHGGGIYTGLPATVKDSTVAGNTGETSGGNIYAPASPNTLLRNTIVAGGIGTSGRDLIGSFDSGFSLIGTAAGASVTSSPLGSNLLGANPQLGPLQMNGGTTPTRRPAFSSPVLDKGVAGFSADQRGLTRPIQLPSISNASGGNGSDIGAVELTTAEATPPPPPPAAGGGQPIAAPPQRAKRCKKKHKKRAAAAKKKCKRKKKR